MGKPSQADIQKLAYFFHRNGYVRWFDPKRRSDPKYKRGDEIRLPGTQAELEEIRVLLEKAGFKLGKPFSHAKQFRQPVYGRKQVLRFLELVDAPQTRPKKRSRIGKGRLRERAKIAKERLGERVNERRGDGTKVKERGSEGATGRKSEKRRGDWEKE